MSPAPPYLIGQAITSNTIPVTTAPAAGDALVVCASATSPDTVTGVTDSSGTNVYSSPAGASNGTSPASYLYGCPMPPVLLTGSSTFSVGYSGSAGRAASAVGVPGAGAVDAAGCNDAQGTGTAVSVTSLPLATPGETVLAVVTFGGGGTSFAWGPGWTVLAAPFRSGTTEFSTVAWATGGFTGSTVTAAGTITNSTAWTAAVMPLVMISIAGTWSASVAALEAFELPPPGIASLPVPVQNTAGDWLICLATWRQVAAGAGVTVSVADDAHNWWEPLGDGQGDSPAPGVTRSAIWVCPAARVGNTTTGITNVMVAPTGFVLSLAALILDITGAGLRHWLQLTAIDPEYAIAATTLSNTVGGAGVPTILLAIAGTDDNADTVTGPGAGWTALPSVTASNGSDHTADIQLSAAWQVSAAGVSAAWSSSGVLDWSGVLGGAAVAAAAPVQPNPSWPVVYTEIDPTSGAQTPPSEIQWMDASALQRALTMTQGRQYTLGQLQAGTGTVTLDNPLGALIPPGTGPYAGIDSGTPIRVRMINPGQLNPHNVIFSGYFQRWPPGWDSAERGLTQATITDVWANANATLRTILRAEVLNDGPYAYWPMSDPAGATQASNIATGGSGLPLNLVISKYGSNGATQAFGANSGALPGDTSVTPTTSGQTASSSGMWQQALAGTSLTVNGNGYTLSCADSNYPAITGGVTISGWLEPQDAAPNWDMIVWIIKDGRGAVLQLSVSHTTGNLLLTWWNTSGQQQSAITVSTATDYRNLGIPYHVAVVFSTTQYTVLVDGGGVSVASGTFGPLRPSFTLFSANGQADRLATGNMWTGFLAHWAIFPAMLPQVRCLTHWFAGQFAITDDSASGRIERLLQAASVTGRRCILPETGPDVDQMVSCSDIAGQPAATSLTNVASAALPAMLAVAPTGDTFYLAKQYCWNQPVRWVIGDDTAAGEIPYLPLKTSGLDYDPSRVVNDVQLTHLDRQDVILPTGQAATDAMASQAQYGDVTYWQTGYLDGDATKPYSYGPGLADLANWLAETFGTPRLRGVRIQVNAAAHPAAWPFYAGAAVGDMVQLNVRPVTAAPLVISLIGRITQTDRALSFGEDGKVDGTIGVAIDGAPEYNCLTCDDPVRGQLTGVNVLGW